MWTIKYTRTSKVFSHKVLIAEDFHEVASITRTCDDAEDEANARLIAAAPELLEALKGLMKEAVKLAESQPDNAPIWAWIDDASDAIAKAEGN